MTRKRIMILISAVIVILSFFTILFIMPLTKERIRNEIEISTKSVDVLTVAQAFNITSEEIEQIDDITVIDVNRKNQRIILDDLEIGKIEKNKTNGVNKIYMITYKDDITRIHVIEYNLITSDFGDVNDKRIFKIGGYRGKIGQIGFDSRKTTVVKRDKVIQVMDDIQGKYTTVLMAKQDITYQIRVIEGIDEQTKAHYSDSTREIISDTSTPHFSDHLWLRERAIQYVEDFGFGEVWMDSE